MSKKIKLKTSLDENIEDSCIQEIIIKDGRCSVKFLLSTSDGCTLMSAGFEMPKISKTSQSALNKAAVDAIKKKLGV